MRNDRKCSNTKYSSYYNSIPLTETKKNMLDVWKKQFNRDKWLMRHNDRHIFFQSQVSTCFKHQLTLSIFLNLLVAKNRRTQHLLSSIQIDGNAIFGRYLAVDCDRPEEFR